jgi:hypothetical protein
MIFSIERQALTVSSSNPTNPSRCVRICAFLGPGGPVIAVVTKPLVHSQLVNHVSLIISFGTADRAKGSRQAESLKG